MRSLTIAIPAYDPTHIPDDGYTLGNFLLFSDASYESFKVYSIGVQRTEGHTLYNRGVQYLETLEAILRQLNEFRHFYMYHSDGNEPGCNKANDLYIIKKLKSIMGIHIENPDDVVSELISSWNALAENNIGAYIYYGPSRHKLYVKDNLDSQSATPIFAPIDFSKAVEDLSIKLIGLEYDIEGAVSREQIVREYPANQLDINSKINGLYKSMMTPRFALNFQGFDFNDDYHRLFEAIKGNQRLRRRDYYRQVENNMLPYYKTVDRSRSPVPQMTAEFDPQAARYLVALRNKRRNGHT